jgi:hypothetical protein
MGKSKMIGTKAETAVVKVLQANGWPSAERRALGGEGGQDRGDITGTPGVTWQVKGGHMAEGASDSLIEEWLASTEKQRLANHDPIGVLVWKRYAVGEANAHRWWAAMHAWQVHALFVDQAAYGVTSRATTDLGRFVPAQLLPVRMTLEQAIHLLHHGGYGDGG